MNKTAVLCFSPTGSTKTVCRTIAEGVPETEVEILDMTRPAERTAALGKISSGNEEWDHFVIGVPVYGCKVPAAASAILEQIEGRGRTATAVVVYGNNTFGTALRSLCDILISRGFKLGSAGAFIGEHPYGVDPPVAAGRPDPADLKKASEFGEKIKPGTDSLDLDRIPAVPNMFSRSKSEMGISPTYLETACKKCGLCSAACPQGIIEKETGRFTAGGEKSCLGCLACVKACPNGGRAFLVGRMRKMMGKMVLSKAARIRNDPITVI